MELATLRWNGTPFCALTFLPRLMSARSSALNAGWSATCGRVKCMAVAICVSVWPRAPAYVIASAMEMQCGEKKRFFPCSAGSARSVW